MTEAPVKRRRATLRFSLRTAFAVLTLAAALLAWVGSQWRVVQERQRLRAEIEQAGGTFQPVTFLTLVVAQTFDTRPRMERRHSLPSFADLKAEFQKRSQLPFPRKWFGDEPIQSITLPFPYSQPHVGPIRAAFPEATIEPFRPEHH